MNCNSVTFHVFINLAIADQIKNYTTFVRCRVSDDGLLQPYDYTPYFYFLMVFQSLNLRIWINWTLKAAGFVVGVCFIIFINPTLRRSAADRGKWGFWEVVRCGRIHRIHRIHGIHDEIQMSSSKYFIHKLVCCNNAKMSWYVFDRNSLYTSSVWCYVSDPSLCTQLTWRENWIVRHEK